MVHSAQTMAGRRVIVTGAGGFVGGFVMKSLAEAGATPIGLTRQPQPASGQHWASADLVTDPLDALLTGLRPDAVIHCAGRTATPDTDEGRADLFAANLTATARLISAVSRQQRRVRLVIVSSAAIWAPMPPGLSMIDERHPMRPVAAYGVSKAAATLHALAESDRLDLDLAVAVPFNILGPGQPQRLVPQVFIEQLRADPVAFTLTNRAAVRDWVDVRDVATALVALARPEGPRGLFNVASGDGRSLEDMLAAVCRIGGWQPVIRDSASHNAHGVSRSVGDPMRLMAATGWTRRFTLDDSLRDMIFPAVS